MDLNTAQSILSVTAQGSIVLLGFALIFFIFAAQTFSSDIVPARRVFGLMWSRAFFWAVFTFCLISIFYSLIMMVFVGSVDERVRYGIVGFGILFFGAVILSIYKMLRILLQEIKDVLEKTY